MIWYFCILHQEWLLWWFRDIARELGSVLTLEQKRKLDEAMVLVGRTQLPFCCNVCLHGHCCTMASHMYASCHCNAKLPDDVEFLYRSQEAKAVAIGQCVDMMVAEPQPDEPMPKDHQDMCSGKGTGMLLRVPQLGDEDGPMWVDDAWLPGYRLWVGHLRHDTCRTTIGQYCDGYVDVAVRSKNEEAYAIMTFIDVAIAIKALSSWP